MNNLSFKSYLRSPVLITIASLTVAYVLAYAIDASLLQLWKDAKITFNFRPVILLSSIIPVVVVIGILALSWLALRHLTQSRFTAIAFIISGLFVVGEYLSYFIIFPTWLHTTIISRFRYALMNFGAQSSIYYLASACIVIGIAALVRYRTKPHDSSQHN